MQDFSGMVGAPAEGVFDATGMTAAETAAVASMREELATGNPEAAAAAAAAPEEVKHDYFFLRFLRGHLGPRRALDPAAALAAYRLMLEYRQLHGLNAITDELRASGMTWPWEMPQFAELRQAVGERGITHLHTADKAGNVLTHVLISDHMRGLRKAINAGRREDYIVLSRYLDEWMLLTLHKRCVDNGRLVGEHLIIDVANIGLFFDRGVFALFKEAGQGWAHYPEKLVHIDDINNSRIALVVWPLVRPFVPAHTTKKLHVSGTNYQGMLLEQINADALPPCMGGTSADKRWSYMDA